MPKLPVVSGREARKAFERAGWMFDMQRGSHMIMSKVHSGRMLSIPDHRELDTGLLRGLIRDGGLSVAEFIDLL